MENKKRIPLTVSEELRKIDIRLKGYSSTNPKTAKTLAVSLKVLYITSYVIVGAGQKLIIRLLLASK
ncbi:hypothetical protein [Acidiphilium angustum]|uniref:hypothetical protein n=1 Tax=Acidiphilium angustum TaxID=523 RepID=UPI0012DE19D4|nr:hypothetical protein [Acidiphilium angustum]